MLQYESQAKPSEHKCRSVQEYQDELMCSSEILVSLLHMDIAHSVINHDLEPAKTRGNEHNIAHFRFA